jgi:hypothetical protein
MKKIKSKCLIYGLLPRPHHPLTGELGNDAIEKMLIVHWGLTCLTMMTLGFCRGDDLWSVLHAPGKESGWEIFTGCSSKAEKLYRLCSTPAFTLLTEIHQIPFT